MKKENLKDLFSRPSAKVKLRLDGRTTIIVRTMNALENWMARYPNATVMAD